MKPPMEEQMSATTPTTTQALPTTPNTGGAPTQQQQAAAGQMMAPAPPGFEGKNLVSLASQLPSDNISPIKTTAPISGLWPLTNFFLFPFFVKNQLIGKSAYQ